MENNIPPTNMENNIPLTNMENNIPHTNMDHMNMEIILPHQIHTIAVLMLFLIQKRNVGKEIMRIWTKEHTAWMIQNMQSEMMSEMILQLIFAQHDDMSIKALEESALIDKMITSCIEHGDIVHDNHEDIVHEYDKHGHDDMCLRHEYICGLIIQILHAPYITTSSSFNDPIFNDLSSSSQMYNGSENNVYPHASRKFSSRKVRMVLHSLLTDNTLSSMIIYSLHSLTTTTQPGKLLDDINSTYCN